MTDIHFVPLPGEILAIDGADASAFAQAQTMNDVAGLADSEWHWNGWLTPKGRLVAFFALYRQSAQSLLLWLPAGGGEALRERLQRYVFRSKVKLTLRNDLVGLGCFGDDESTVRSVARLTLPLQDGHARTLLICLLAEVDNVTGASEAHSGADIDGVHAWRLADLQLGIPYVAAGAVNSEQFVPQWLSLERLSAFSVKKGCYPGQEIVARMHFLGQSKRAAYQLHGDGAPPEPMARVLDAGGTGIGEVVWSTSDGPRWRALAAINSDKAATVHAVEGSGSSAVED